MPDPDRSRAPGWVRRRDGQLAPFDPDEISRSLFAATEQLGRPDPFLARELTDGVVHFLRAETDRRVTTTSQIGELVVTVVRELGQPAVAQAYAALQGSSIRSPTTVPVSATLGPSPDELVRCVTAGARSNDVALLAGRAWLRAYALRHIFAPDLAAAHEAGIIRLDGLEAPLEPAAAVLDPPQTDLFPSARDATRTAGCVLALDGFDYRLALHRISPETAVQTVKCWVDALSAAGAHGILNLNISTPAPWAESLASGPLFGAAAPDADAVARAADELLEASRCDENALHQLRIDWHLCDRDFSPQAESRLLRMARLAHPGMAFVFDRLRRPVALAEGLNRDCRCALMSVAIDLVRLAQRQPAVRPDTPEFLRRLASAAQLAVSAGVQKREYLRRHTGEFEWKRAFRLERAALVVVPVGLTKLASDVPQSAAPDSMTAAEFPARILRHLKDMVVAEGVQRSLDVRIDSMCSYAKPFGQAFVNSVRVVGLTAGDPTLSPELQVKMAATCHAVAGAGTAAVFVDDADGRSAGVIAHLLGLAWRSGIVRLVFLHSAPGPAPTLGRWNGGPQSPESPD